MIVRTWRGWAAASNRAAYPDHFRKHVLPELKGIAGFLEASLLQQDRQGEVGFLVLTRWASIEAVRAFAGDDISRVVVEPEAVAALVSFDRSVQHYELVEELQPD